jgi:putative phosphoesterase
MIRIAVLSDIHGNLHALEATQRDLSIIAPDLVIVNGDIVGRGPQSAETLERVASLGWTVVQGNHEAFWDLCANGQAPDDWQDGWWNPIRQAVEALDPTWISWMADLPQEHIIEVPGAPPIQIVHGSPNNLSQGLYAHDTDQKLDSTLAGTPYEAVIGAHTHVPMIRRTPQHWVMNCGSVGAPFNRDPAAQYLLLDWDGQHWDARPRRVEYDRDALLRYWRECGYWDSGVAAQVFAYEIETASFHFWHYVRYCKNDDLDLNDPASFARYREDFPASFVV